MRNAPIAVLAVSLVVALPASAQKFAVMGDSLSDEYAEASYGLYAQNWVQQLVIHAGLDAGPTGSWGEPRRNFYEYNWARAGANSSTLLSQGQHSGLASQVVPEGIEYAVLMIGANDFSPGGTAYQNIYAGNWTQATIDAHVNGILANITTALDTAVLPTGVKLVVANIPDYGVTPTVQQLFPDPSGRQAVRDVIIQASNGIEVIAQQRGLVYVDFLGAEIAIFGPHGSPNAVLTIGNVDIFLAQSDTNVGGNPTAGFVHDGIHPNTTFQGIVANFMLEAINIGYGAGLPLFTEAEILSHRGIAYGGSDTLLAQLGNYSDYITSFVPQPTPVPALGLVGRALVAAFFLAAALPAARRLRG